MSGTTGPDVVACEVVVRGVVQGVWFRDTCRREAEGLGVTGWVRNEYDGSVRARFEGPGEAVAQLVAWAHQGPPHARVDAVEVTDVEPSGDDRFRVR